MASKRTLALSLGLAVLAALAGSARAQAGPSTSESPYLVAESGDVALTALLTLGDEGDGLPGGEAACRMAGLPGGMGAYDNGDGTFTLLAGREAEAGDGDARAQGSVSAWRIRKSDLRVLGGEDAIKVVRTWDSGLGDWVETPDMAFARFGSANLPGASAFFNRRTGLGFPGGGLFLIGEEKGPEGRVFAHIFQGDRHGGSYELPSLGKAGWGNFVASPYEQDRTVAIGLDASEFGQLHVYTGMKRSRGNPVELAGLHGGALHAVAVAGTPVELRTLAVVSGTSFSLVAASGGAGTSFLRPRDGAWDPRNPDRFYFVTADRLDQIKARAGSQTGRSRLWRLNFASIDNPEAGGTVDLLLDGTGAGQMYGSIAVDGSGRLLLQEAAGEEAHNGRIWRYDPADGAVSLLARHDLSRFGDIGIPPAPGFNPRVESTGLFEVSGLLEGAGYDTAAFRYFFANVRARGALPDPDQGRKGQLLLMRVLR